MTRRKATLLVAALLATSVPMMWLGWRLTVDDGHEHPQQSVRVKVQLSGVDDRADLVRNDDGTFHYVLWNSRGEPEHLSPDELARRLHVQQEQGGILATVFNITSPLGLIWIGVGLLGQVLFTGRMIVQWLASEKNRKSVVPPVFWWMSTLGAMMLLAYFIWRRDIVGVLGQSFGAFIYVRNLHLIYKEQRRLSAAAGEVAGQLQ